LSGNDSLGLSMEKEIVKPDGLEAYNTSFWGFVLDPNERIRLKTLFENARNYTILVVILGSGIVITRDATTVFALGAGVCLSIAGAALGVFNVAQSWLISLRLFDQYHGFNNMEHRWDTVYRLVSVVGSLFGLPLGVWYLVKLLIEQIVRR
jgi:hypothetical protein